MSKERGIYAVQDGNTRIEYVKPDLAQAYVEIAPFITESRAFMKCKDHYNAMISLNKACAVIDQVSMRMAFISNSVQPPVKEPGTTR